MTILAGVNNTLLCYTLRAFAQELRRQLKKQSVVVSEKTSKTRRGIEVNSVDLRKTKKSLGLLELQRKRINSRYVSSLGVKDSLGQI